MQAETRFFYCPDIMIGQIKNLIQPILGQEQVELVDLTYRWESGLHSGAGRNVLRLLIDKQGGVNLDDCARINKTLSNIIDSADLISGSFVLEVSSPGIDRPLSTKWDFQKHAGKDVKFIVKNDLGTTDTIIGNVKNVSDDRLTIGIKGGEREILFVNIIKAKLEIKI